MPDLSDLIGGVADPKKDAAALQPVAAAFASELGKALQAALDGLTITIQVTKKP